MIGEKIAHYEILDKIGAGGMGEVYRARDTTLDRDVALKVLPTELAQDPDRLARFEREAKALAALDHPGIVAIHSVESDDHIRFLTMQLVEGRELADRIDGSGMAPNDFLELASQLADALAAAHERGVVHRDLKPQNILVTDDGRVKVLDFGLAKLRPEPEPEEKTAVASESLTRDGRVMGTWPYMSPEQLEGGSVDTRSDIFSLGIVLYEMATGARPFQGESPVALGYAIVKETPPDVDELRPELPRDLARIIRRCLEKEPRLRFQSALDIRNELDDLRRELETGAILETREARQSARDRTLKRRWALLGGAGALALLGGWLWLTSRTQPPPTPPVAPPASTDSQIRALAVLPFSNLMQDPEQDYFVQGMHEALIADLSQISSLRVISRTSAMLYPQAGKSMPQIAQELDVDALIEGSVLRAGDEVRIRALLVHGDSDESLWSGEYDRELQDVLVLLSEVAQKIAAEIEAVLTPAERALLASAPSVDPAVHELYLKGRYYFNQGTPDGLRSAVRLHQEALDLDPGFAPAWAGLASAYGALGFFGVAPLSETVPQAKAAAARALEIDERLGAAHAVVGMTALYFDWDWETAARALKRALQLDPTDSLARHGYADYLLVTNDLEGSMREVERARQYDPLSRVAQLAVAGHLMFEARFDEAIDACRQMLERSPGDTLAREWIGDALWALGRHEEALAEFRAAREPGSELIQAMERGRENGGPLAARRARAEWMAARFESGAVRPLAIAEEYAAARDVEKTFEWLERAYELRQPQLLHLKAVADFSELRAEPRFLELAERIGFPQ